MRRSDSHIDPGGFGIDKNGGSGSRPDERMPRATAAEIGGKTESAPRTDGGEP